ncbi:hypothetical protein BH11ACT8_BH11ACT8_19470 [soil metagenome]
MTVTPDTKDWTWVLDQPCPECGFDATGIDVAAVAAQVRDNASWWALALTAPAAARRPRPGAWAPSEYAAPVRDVHRIFGERLASMLAEDEPTFANWDQDEAAVAGEYYLADPASVSTDLVAAAEAAAAAYDAVPASAVDRPGRRSNGSTFTVLTLARYHLHDVVHHLWDVRGALTVAAYDRQAAAYQQASTHASEAVTEATRAFAAAVGAGARVLEIGSGGGRDAVALEALGCDVRRSDITPGFVEVLRRDGHDAEVLDPLTDDLTDTARDGRLHDAVWANACLLHVTREDLPEVLARLAAVTRADGVIRATFKEGDGDGWATHGSIEAPRRFTYWRRPALEAVVAGSGWRVLETVESDGLRAERWLAVTARRVG